MIWKYERICYQHKLKSLSLHNLLQIIYSILLKVVESSINVKENVRKCNFIGQFLTLGLIPNPRKPCEDVPWPPKWILNLPWKSYLIWKSRFDMKIRMKVCHTITLKVGQQYFSACIVIRVKWTFWEGFERLKHGPKNCLFHKPQHFKSHTFHHQLFLTLEPNRLHL